MRNCVLLVAVALLSASVSQAQRPGGPPRNGPVERVLEEMKLTGEKRDAARETARAYTDSVERLTNLASADLVLKLKGVLDEKEYTALVKATERARTAPVGPGGQFGAGGPGGRGGRGGAGLGDAAVVERILSFDKNKDGFVTKDELPERMQYLIEKGDTNKDGKLDAEEIKKVASQVARQDPPRRPGPVASGRLTPRAVERALDDLKLSESKKMSVSAAVKACKEGVSKLKELAKAELTLRANDTLSPEDALKFTAAVERFADEGSRRGPRGQ